MPSYRLTYFNLRARAEPARWIFVYTGQSYVDDRFEGGEKWKDIKPTTPYGKVPVLYVDDKPIYSGIAICQYLGKVLKISPTDPFSEAICTEVADVINDLLKPMYEIMMAKKANDQEKVKTLAKEFLGVTFQQAGTGLNNKLKKSKYFTGDKVSWADIYAACYLTPFIEAHPELEGKYSELYRMCKSIYATPSIAKWIKERPETSM